MSPNRAGVNMRDANTSSLPQSCDEVSLQITDACRRPHFACSIHDNSAPTSTDAGYVIELRAASAADTDYFRISRSNAHYTDLIMTARWISVACIRSLGMNLALRVRPAMLYSCPENVSGHLIHTRSSATAERQRVSYTRLSRLRSITDRALHRAPHLFYNYIID